jgi:hypothetical protein
MNTTLKQMTLPTPKGDEVLDMTEFATNESVVNGLASVESKVEAESQAIQSAIHDIDLSSVESKVDEVKQAVDDIDLTPIENKVQEGVNFLSVLIDNIDLSAVENKVLEESAAIQAKIDNIELPEIDTSAIAKQGDNADATNTAIYEEVKNVKNTFDSLDIPISAISGLALELEDGKKNIVNALNTRGVAASVNTDTLTSLAEKVYKVKNPVAFTVPAETSNKVADDFFNTMMKSQGYDQIYESVYETYCGEGSSYVGCLMTDLSKGTNTSIQLIGADAYYIYEEDVFYKTGEGGKLIQFLNGSEVQLATDKHIWDADIANPCRIVFYLYLPNSTANGQRENVHASNIDYCRNSSIPYIKYSSNSGRFMYFHLSNPESCVLSYGTGNNTRTVFFYSNVETCSATMALTGNQDYMDFLHLESLKTVTAGTVVHSSKIRHIEFPNLEEITGGTLLSNQATINELILPKLTYIYRAMLIGPFNNSTLKANDSSYIYIDLSNADTVVEDRNQTNGIINTSGTVRLKLKSGVSVSAVLGAAGKVTNAYIDCEELWYALTPTYSVFKATNIFFEGLRKGHIWLGSTGAGVTSTRYIYINCIGGRNDEIYLQHSTNAAAYAGDFDIEISQGARQPLKFYLIRGLTVDSIVNHIFERLADNRFEDDGVTPAPAIKIEIGSVNLAKLTDAQKAIATDKNYILA